MSITNESRQLIKDLHDVEEIEKVPLSEQYAFRNTYEILEYAAKTSGKETALQFLQEGIVSEAPFKVTYDELFRRVTQTANLFHRLGIKTHEVVAYILPNLPQTHYVIWGGEAAGIVSAINPFIESSQIADLLLAVRARVLVTLAPCPEFNLWEKIRPILSEIPSIETVLQIDIEQFKRADYRPSQPLEEHVGKIRVLNYDSEIACEPSNHLVSGRSIRPDDIASYFHTGGTTGMPKIASQTHANQVFMAWSMGRARNLMQPGEVSFCGLPLFHANAVFVSGLGVFYARGSVLLAGTQGFRSPEVRKNFWKIVERYKISYFSAVPTVYAALLDIPKGDADISSLQFGFCGAAPMPTEIFRRFEQFTGVKILEGYGLTEGTLVSTGNPPGGERRIGSIGIRYPYQDVKVAMLDENGKFQRDAKIEEVGYIIIKGPNIFPGYLSEHDNRNIWLEDDWLNTGDLGRIDKDGYFWLTGRAKDLIIRGGHNIDPQAIESVLCKHPAVAMASVVGQPDSYAGEVPVAYVVLREGATASAEELLAFGRDKIGERAAVPVRIEIMNVLPMTAVGKVFKPQLRFRAIEHVLNETFGAAGIRADVCVNSHPTFGTLAQITLLDEKTRSQVEALLGRFHVKHEIK